MSFVVVLPAEPTTATTCALALRADERRERGQRHLLVVGDERRRAARARLLDELDAGVQRDEEIAGADLARVRLDRGDRRLRHPAVQPPELERARSPRSASGITTRASKRSRARPRGRRTERRRRRRPAPARAPSLRSRRRPRRRASDDRARDRAAPVRVDLDVQPVPWRTSWMIASGSSERGLSEVTIATSASSAATFPISGRFPRSRSPPAPKTTITRPAPRSRAARRTVASESGVCA